LVEHWLPKLLRAAERRSRRDETICRLIERRLGGTYSRTLGVELPRLAGDDRLSHAQYRAELVARRRAWLEDRFNETKRREEIRADLSRAQGQGLSRFIHPGRSLDDLIETMLDTPAAFQELREQRRARESVAHEDTLLRVESEIAQRSA
jgi:hypothetical protein